MILVLLAGGLVMLAAGAELLVRGASALAARLGVSLLVIGLTVVAFGTSAPELAVSLHAALTGNAAISLGNVIGSNIFNLLLILGISGLLMPLTVSLKVVKFDAPIMAVATVLLLVLCADGSIGRIDGFLLTILFIAYTLFAFIRENSIEHEASAYSISHHGIKALLFFVLAGIALLVLGSQLLTRGAVMTARFFGISDLIVGLTIVAGGTSLPELAASVTAALKHEPDMAVGNIIGSNIFNIFGILGITTLVSPVAVPPEALAFSLPVLAVMTVFSLPLFISGLIIDRLESGILLFSYVTYIAILICREAYPGAIQSILPALIVVLSLAILIAMIVPFLRTKH